jgi:hypothetical protein
VADSLVIRCLLAHSKAVRAAHSFNAGGINRLLEAKPGESEENKAVPPNKLRSAVS